MKISNEPVTLSPRHSRWLRALMHASGYSEIDKLLEDTFFPIDAENNLSCIAADYRNGTPISERLWEAQELAAPAENDWEAFVKIAEKMPVYRASNYQSVTA